MIRKWVAKNEAVFVILTLTIISAIVYLPLIWRIGYVNDDWYLMYSAGAYGPKAFIDIFSVDRPARALVMIPAYYLFGNNPLYYNLSAYVFRLISALAFLWLLRMLFPRQDKATLLGSLLFLIYPGFLSQHNGIDYQSQMVSLAAAMLSIVLSVKAILTKRRRQRFVLLAFSMMLGWLYLGLVEYFIGFELLRFASVFLLSNRNAASWKRGMWDGTKLWIPNIFTPFVFLLWRVLFFQGDRTATDINIQFDQVKSYPIQTIYHWGIQVLRDLFTVFIPAWATPLSQLKGYIQYWGVILAIVVAGLFLYALFSLKNKEEQNASQRIFTHEAIVLGLLIAIGGLIPIAMVNRGVSFPSYSRYSLVSSAGVALVFTSLFVLLRNRILQYGFAALLVIISILTHHANTVKAVQQTSLTRDFWWQVSWRVPQFEKNTTLIANYPGVVLEEDYFIWGPANLIYYPEKQNEQNIQPGLFAAILNKDTVEKVLARERQEYDKRKTIVTYANYRNILIMTQPGMNSCVHIIDGTQPEYSDGEWEFVRDTGPYSEIEHVLVDATPHTPPTVVFGPEPAHGWCYYYQKADLARQRGEWDEVQKIGEQAFGQGFEPKDAMEWIPFLQAYATNGDGQRLRELAPKITFDLNVSMQACQILGSMPSIPNATLEIIVSLYCVK